MKHLIWHICCISLSTRGMETLYHHSSDSAPHLVVFFARGHQREEWWHLSCLMALYVELSMVGQDLSSLMPVTAHEIHAIGCLFFTTDSRLLTHFYCQSTAIAQRKAKPTGGGQRIQQDMDRSKDFKMSDILGCCCFFFTDLRHSSFSVIYGFLNRSNQTKQTIYLFILVSECLVIPISAGCNFDTGEQIQSVHNLHFKSDFKQETGLMLRLLLNSETFSLFSPIPCFFVTSYSSEESFSFLLCCLDWC